MKDKKRIAIVSLIILLILFAWSPWITKRYSENIANEKFTEKWRGVLDGCGFNCDGCGIKDSHKTLFSYVVRIEYACGFKADFPENHRISNLYISPLGNVYGLEN